MTFEIDTTAKRQTIDVTDRVREIVPIENGDLRLGRWQGLMLVELDGPRRGRRVIVTLTRAEAV